MPDEKFRELTSLRAEIEAFGASRTVRRAAAEPALLDRLRDICARIRRAAHRGDCVACREADAEFHETVMDMSGVPGLAAMWKIAWEKLGAFYLPRFDHDVSGWRNSVVEHEYLLETIRLGEPVAAEEAVRNHIEATYVSQCAAMGTPDAERDVLFLATRHMAAQLQYPLRLGDVAARVARVCPRHLTRLFHRQHGMGFKAYLQKLRMAKAAELMAGTRLPVATVARRVGYRNFSLFAAHFVRAGGLPPRAWRKKHGGHAHFTAAGGAISVMKSISGFASGAHSTKLP
ncbi:FCD domain-containing protein [Termitidicoccus mucosus]|uniref:HTH araC/xylS-type domain-containing protein n=1 Tax=Termitidicoccus mucosus TaxID=1184151 RepID=A0A178IDJ9_9BACT|nr:hypothetical protein AW736_18635 [Opitutaceae bacterium TSB47]